MNYLRSLPAATRAFLISSLEKAAQAGQDVPGSDFILNALRKVEEEAAAAADALGKPRDFLFASLDPFLVDEVGDKKLAGQIDRASLDPIWTWLERDAAPKAMEHFSAQMREALLAKNDEAAKAAAGKFQPKLASLIDKQLSAFSDDDTRRRAVAQLGGERVMDDLKDMAAIFRQREALAAIAKRLPAQVKNFVDEPFDTAFVLLNQPAVRKPDIFPYALVMLMARLTQKVQVMRLALRAAESDAPSKIAETPFALGIELLLSRIGGLAAHVKATIASENYDAAGPAIKELHDIMRGLRSEMDLSSDGPWSRRLASVRADVATLVKPVLDGLPGQIRRLLRIHPPGDRTHVHFDPDEIATIGRQIDFLIVCRNFAGELSINEVTRRVMGEVQSYLESQPTALIEALRTAQGDTAATIIKQIETSVGFCTHLFGANHAQLLQKSADVVINSEKKGADKKASDKKAIKRA